MGNVFRFIARGRTTSKTLGSAKSRRGCCRPAEIERLEDRRLLSTISFDGLAIRGGDPHDAAAPGLVPPDTMGTVSPSYIVQLINGEYRWQSRSGGAATVHTDAVFWENAGISSPQHLTDPRILYDPLTSRFIATEQVNALQPSNNGVLIATSAGGDPSDTPGNWKATFLPTSTGTDFPTLGVDNAGVYIAVNVFNLSTGAYVSSSIYALPLSDIFWATGSSPTTANAQPFLNLQPGSTFQPAVDFTAGKQSSSPEFITNRIESISGTGYTGIATRKLTWTGIHSATLSSATTASFGTNYALPVAAAQPGTNGTSSGSPYLDDGDGRLTNTLVVSGSIWTIAPSSIQGNDGAVVAQISNSNLGTIAQQQVLWAPGDAFLYPSLAVNSSGTIAVGATGVSSNTYPSAFVFGRLASDPQGSWAPTQVAEQGIANYSETGGEVNNVARWGDYSVTLLDPSNSSVFWTLQEDVEYPDSGFPNSDNWTTVWRAFSINAGGASVTNLPPTLEAAPMVKSPASSTLSTPSALEASPDVLDALQQNGWDVG